MPIKQSQELQSGNLPFFDLYPVCSRLLCELGQVFINGLSEEQASPIKDQFVERLVSQGFSRENVELSWNFILENRSEETCYTEAGTEEISHISSQVVNSMNRATREGKSAGDNVFSFEDGRWVVRFNGKTIYPQDISGIKYLHWLISNPNQTFSPRTLYEGFGTRSQVNATGTVDGMPYRGVAANRIESDMRLGQREKSEMLDRLNDIENEMVAAKRVPDADLIERLADERIQIREELRKTFTAVGNRRIQEPDLVRRMKAVDIAIRRAKEKIQRAGHHDLLTHLNDSIEIKVKSGCRYAPRVSLTWRTKAADIAPSIKPR